MSHFMYKIETDMNIMLKKHKAIFIQFKQDRQMILK
jgi:hypothetical protein